LLRKSEKLSAMGWTVISTVTRTTLGQSGVFR